MAAASTISQHPPPPSTGGYDNGSTATTFCDIPADIFQSHILNLLDARALASTACVSRHLHSLSTQPHLWSHLCHCTWPSTLSPGVRRLIADAGPHSFFSDCFMLPLPPADNHCRGHLPRIAQLISAVDIRRGDDNLLFSRVIKTDTTSAWFQCSPFRIDMLGLKESVQIPAHGDDACASLAGELRLSWIVADGERNRVANISSGEPVSVQRHWLTGEVEARFAAVMGGGKEKGPTECVEFGIVVTCGVEEEGGGLHVREVSLRAEDMDGKQMTGRDGIVILGRALLEGKRGKGVREVEGKRGYEEFVEKKRERRERRVREEKRLDKLCLGIGASLLAAFCLFFL